MNSPHENIRRESDCSDLVLAAENARALACMSVNNDPRVAKESEMAEKARTDGLASVLREFEYSYNDLKETLERDVYSLVVKKINTYAKSEDYAQYLRYRLDSVWRGYKFDALREV
jgi:hypothetical protein